MERARVLFILGGKISNEKGELEKGFDMLNAAEAILRKLGSEGRWDLGYVLLNKGWIMRFMGDESAAQIFFDGFTSAILELGDVWGEVYWILADKAWRSGDFDLAKKYCEDYRVRSREIGIG